MEDSYGNKYWRNKEWQYHREDGPAFEGSNKTKEWWVNGKHHRIGGPAIEDADGFKAWYISDKLHRFDGPAVDDANGFKEWWVDNNDITNIYNFMDILC